MQPIDVVQVYTSKEVFTKPTYTPEHRKRFAELEPSYESTQGYLEAQVLVLPVAHKSRPEVEQAGLVVIQDIRGWEALTQHQNPSGAYAPNWLHQLGRDRVLLHHQTLFSFQQPTARMAFELFKIRKSESGYYELYLDYTGNYMHIGFPEREDHKVCNLKPGIPIRYKINGKSDFTMSGRKERTFYEYDFIIEWIGPAESIAFRELSKIRREKRLPLQQVKVIDERKLLW